VATSEGRIIAIETRDTEREKYSTKDVAARNASGASLLASGALFIWQKFFTP
jgi:hypothetical protein